MPTETYMNQGAIEVQIISASWCKRCGTVKPDVAKFCGMNGAVFTEVDYDAMDDGAEKDTVKSLPTIRMRLSPSAPWFTYTADTLDIWKSDIVRLAPADMDF